MDVGMQTFLEERDSLFNNPTLIGAHAFWKKQGFSPPVRSDVPLASIHKARLQWLDATDAQLATIYPHDFITC